MVRRSKVNGTSMMDIGNVDKSKCWRVNPKSPYKALVLAIAKQKRLEGELDE